SSDIGVRIHKTRENEFGLLLVIGRDGEVVVLESWVFAPRFGEVLKGGEGAQEGQTAHGEEECFPPCHLLNCGTGVQFTAGRRGALCPPNSGRSPGLRSCPMERSKARYRRGEW